MKGGGALGGFGWLLPWAVFFLSLLEDQRQEGEGSEGKTSGGEGMGISPWAHLPAAQLLSHLTPPPCCPLPPTWRAVSSWINFSQWTPEEGPLLWTPT